MNKTKEKKSGNLKDFILKVVLNQVHTISLGLKCLLKPGDIKQMDIHWDLKVMIVSDDV